jgi:2-polyprenyl-3-methyl-5-hydroxy-6-metoxy-1,4-benzoquinol methylase
MPQSSYKNHPIFKLLIDLGLSTPDSVKLYHPSVRDRDDISVVKCQKSQVIFLSDCDHITSVYYSNHSLNYWSVNTRNQARLKNLEDDTRRAQQFQSQVCNKRWLDFGTGAGGILDLLSEKAAETFAVEPQNEIRQYLVSQGYQVVENCEFLRDDYFDIITLFHVYEHLINPVEVLKTLKSKLKSGGKIIVEVPHARDFLIDFLDLDSFKKNTFWSEHLILHTRESLAAFISASGFTEILIQGFQRYPLANHLYWLSQGKPGGHHEWNYLRNVDLDAAYSSLLTQIDKTDTLIAFCKK